MVDQDKVLQLGGAGGGPGPGGGRLRAAGQSHGGLRVVDRQVFSYG